MKTFYVYILTNTAEGVLYTGVTSNLVKRIFHHKIKAVSGFTQKYGLHKLVYFEKCPDALAAFQREKKLKRWRRSWKIELIRKFNPDWRDLYPDII